MNAIDVKRIIDIPSIEDYFQIIFTLLIYEVGDRTIIYECELPNRNRIAIDINSEESLILGQIDLAEIITHYKIDYLQFSVYNDLGDVVSSHCYRPHVEESNKNY